MGEDRSGGAGMKGPIVILGAAGMLGHKLFQRLSRSFETVAAVRSRWEHLPEPVRQILPREQTVATGDVTEWETLVSRLEQIRPAVVVNCVGIIKQRSEAKTAIPSLTINALLPHRLAERLATWDARLIHFSTDCVFSGTRGNYREDDDSDAHDLYGKSKFLGEVATDNAITLRTSIIGRELTQHRSLLDWFLSQGNGSVRGFRRAIYSGITTNEMGNVVERLISDFPNLSGLFQVASEPISKFELLHLLRDAYGLKNVIEPDDREVCDRSMSGERFRTATGWQSPAWPELVRDLAADPTPYGQLELAVR